MLPPGDLVEKLLSMPHLVDSLEEAGRVHRREYSRRCLSLRLEQSSTNSGVVARNEADGAEEASPRMTFPAGVDDAVERLLAGERQLEPCREGLMSRRTEVNKNCGKRARCNI